MYRQIQFSIEEYNINLKILSYKVRRIRKEKFYFNNFLL